MSSLLQAVGEAVALGAWTALHPCPLATNIAAMAFIGRRLSGATAVLAAGLLYALGGMLTYALLAALLMAGMRAGPLAAFLQAHLYEILGPILILVAMVLLELVRPRGLNFAWASRWQTSGRRPGPWAALPLGVLLALAFCPISAACFFVSILRLATHHQSPLLVPAAYALGTAAPVILFAFLLALGTRVLGKTFAAMARAQWWTQHVAGGVLLLLGLYFTLKFIYELPLP